MAPARRRLDESEHLTLLVDELLGALEDTARLAVGLSVDWRWHVHLAYVRDLQRLGREALAAAADEPHAPARRCSRGRAHRARAASKFRSSAQRGRARGCARNEHDEGPA